MDNLDFTRDGLLDFSFDGRDTRYPFTTLMARQSWPLPMEQSLSQDNGNQRRSTTPLQSSGLHNNGQHQAFATAHNSPTFFPDWTISQQSQALPFSQDTTTLGSHFTGALDTS